MRGEYLVHTCLFPPLLLPLYLSSSVPPLFSRAGWEERREASGGGSLLSLLTFIAGFLLEKKTNFYLLFVTNSGSIREGFTT